MSHTTRSSAARRRPGSSDRGSLALVLLLLGALAACNAEPESETPARSLLRLVDEPLASGSSSPLLRSPSSPVEATGALAIDEGFDEAWTERWWILEEGLRPTVNQTVGQPSALDFRRGMVRAVRTHAVGACRDLIVEMRAQPRSAAASPTPPCPLNVAELQNNVLEQEQLSARSLARGSTRVLEAVGEPDAEGFLRFRLAFRAGGRTPMVILILSAHEQDAGDWWIDRITLREMSGLERATFYKQEMDALTTPVGKSEVSGRARLGHGFNELLFAPTPSRLIYTLPSSAGTPVWLSFSFGILSHALGRGDGEPTTFRILRQEGHSGSAATRTVFEETLQPSQRRKGLGPHYRRVELAAVGPQGARLILETEADPSAADPTALAAWGHPVVELREPPSPPSPGLIVISVDTVRADRLGCYGSTKGLSPRIDQLATESARFEETYAQVSFTLPSHATVFSGQYPSIHGMTRQGIQRDRDVTVFLAETGRAAGLRTAAFNGGLQLSEAMSIEAGFEVYHVTDAIRHGRFEEIESWLDSIGEQPFLLFLHTYAAHAYRPPDRFLEAVHEPCPSVLHGKHWLGEDFIMPDLLEEVDRKHLAAVYDASVMFADHQIGTVLDLLRARGLLETTPLLLFSDHGEELFEHGTIGHGKTLFEELVRVPLLLRRAGGDQPGVVRELTELVDLHATCLELLGLEGPDRIQQGRSLLPRLSGTPQPPPVEAFFELLPWRMTALRTPRFKAIVQQQESGLHWQVFDVQQDPGELAPLPEEHPLFVEGRRELRDRREQMRALAEELSGTNPDAELDPDTIRALRAAGYLEDEE